MQIGRVSSMGAGAGLVVIGVMVFLETFDVEGEMTEMIFESGCGSQAGVGGFCKEGIEVFKLLSGGFGWGWGV